MASPDSLRQSPQPSCSGYPLDVDVVLDAIPGPSALQVDPSPRAQGPDRTRRGWSCSSVSSEEPALNIWGDPSPLTLFEQLRRKRDWSSSSSGGDTSEVRKRRRGYSSSSREEEAGEEKEEEEEEENDGDDEEEREAEVAPEVQDVSLGPRPQLLCVSRKRKREWTSDEEEEEEEEEEAEVAPKPQDAWEVEALSALKMKIKRRRVSAVFPEHHEAFTRLLEDPVIEKFLAWDKDLLTSDKYLLAMVIAYFSRFGLFSWQIRRIHFFLALYLANDMEEDEPAPKQAIFSFLYGSDRTQRPQFHRLRFRLVRTMGWRARVSRQECEEIQAYNPDLWVWGRDRTLLP
ncbi:speedy protein E4-like [Erinaceus europaeus]|uniref:Speedy protein E4-like n=1 Tax=Erinaceus europaeus TaxID=9365 RepID=A0ABM3VY75_ERIEU|nr:speedy protein E4-like [Erinaceus europaeus]